MAMKYKDMTWGKMEAVVNKLGGMDGVERFLSGESTIKESALLRQITKVSVSGAKKFVAKDHIKVANVGYAGSDFDRLFFNKTEENVEGLTVAIHRLEKDSLDAPILAELRERAQISLAHFFELLEKQSKGEDGVLLTNGYANIAYIKGNDNNLWAVGAYWDSDDGDWNVYAYSFEYPFGWDAGYQVLSRDSL